MEPSTLWPDGELLGFDLETTGVDRFSDVPVSYALVTVSGGDVTERRTGLVDPGRPIPEGATAIHGISTERARAEGVPLDEAVAMLSDALVGASARSIPVVGMKLDYDLTILDVQCRRLQGRGLVELGFTAPVLDALVIDRHYDRYRKGRRTLVDLCALYDVAIGNAHDAAADAEASIRVLRVLSGRYPEISGQSPADLHHLQVAWHREWATGYDEWRRQGGKSPMDPREFEWPIAAASAPGGS
jgi:DNA polymerase-3 subunit epsilon